MTARLRRPGIAALEFVMVWPLLIMMCAGIFLIARASVAKEAAATKARRDAFAARSTADPGEVFHLGHDPLASQAHGNARHRVASGSLFNGQTFEGQSHVFTLGHPWDFHDAPFDPTGPWQPHMGVIRKILGSVEDLGGSSHGVDPGHASSGPPPSLSDARAQLQKNRDDAARTYNQLLEQYKNEDDADKRDELRGQLKDLRDAINKMDEQLKNMPAGK